MFKFDPQMASYCNSITTDQHVIYCSSLAGQKVLECVNAGICPSLHKNCQTYSKVSDTYM
jgi:hypothetical protein